jgi:hypothetical protein
MKIKRNSRLLPAALVALGVFLGRGAQADTVLDWASLPPNQVNNCNGGCAGTLQGFGSDAVVSSDGVDVTNFGTPNIGLIWAANGFSDTQWDYYLNWNTNPGPGGGQLNDSSIGCFHDLSFVPNSPSASVEIESFNFFPWYVSTERFTYNVSVLSGTNVVEGPTLYTFLSDGTNDHPVTIDYTGAPGEALKLRLARLASTLGPGEVEGGAYNIAMSEMEFAQTPETNFPAGPQVVLDTPADLQSNNVAVYDPPVTPVDDQTGFPAFTNLDTQTGLPEFTYPFNVSITNGDTTLVASSIQLDLDGTPVSPPPSISSADGVTNVSYPGTNLILSGGYHTYTLTYEDNLGATYTYAAVFGSIYASIPATYALPQGSGEVQGFTWRTVSANSQVTNSLDDTIARAVAQLDGTLTNPATSLPYTNEAALGPNPDGSFNVTNILNFNDDGFGEGDFPNNQSTFPGLVAGATNQWFSGEGLLYLELPAGYYRFGVNSDDGFEVNALPPQGVSGSPIVLGEADYARGEADTMFDFLAPTSGIYPFQLIYFQGDGASEVSFFAVTNFADEGTILINDPTYTNAIVSYRLLAPNITSIVSSGTNVVLNWAYGAPPFQVQTTTNLADAVWTNFGTPTTNSTASIPIQPGASFFRVFGQ